MVCDDPCLDSPSQTTYFTLAVSYLVGKGRGAGLAEGCNFLSGSEADLRGGVWVQCAQEQTSFLMFI